MASRQKHYAPRLLCGKRMQTSSKSDVCIRFWKLVRQTGSDRRILAPLAVACISHRVRASKRNEVGMARTSSGPRWDSVVNYAKPPAGFYFCFGGLIMMWAPAVPGNISQGALGAASVESPVDSGVAKGV